MTSVDQKRNLLHQRTSKMNYTYRASVFAKVSFCLYVCWKHSVYYVIEREHIKLVILGEYGVLA